MVTLNAIYLTKLISQKGTIRFSYFWVAKVAILSIIASLYEKHLVITPNTKPQVPLQFLQSNILIQQVCLSVSLSVTVGQHRRAGHGRGSGSSTTSSGI